MDIFNICFDPDASFVVPNCTDCEELQDAMSAFITENAKIMVNNEPEQSLVDWVNSSNGRAFTIFTMVGDEFIASYQGLEGFLYATNVCSKFDDAFGGLMPCLEMSAHFTIRASDSASTGSIGTGMFGVTIAKSNPPVVESNLTKNVILCQPIVLNGEKVIVPANTAKTIEMSEFGLGAFGSIDVTTDCRSIEITYSAYIESSCKDCEGNDVDCNSPDATCTPYTLELYATDLKTDFPCFAGMPVARVIFNVLSEVLCLPPIEACVEQATTTPEETLQQIIVATIDNIKNNTKNGCGLLIDSTDISVNVDTERECFLCCRGDARYSVTYTVSAAFPVVSKEGGEEKCSANGSVTQKIRVYDPAWEKYFPSECSCACEEAP